MGSVDVLAAEPPSAMTLISLEFSTLILASHTSPVPLTVPRKISGFINVLGARNVVQRNASAEHAQNRVNHKIVQPFPLFAREVSCMYTLLQTAPPFAFLHLHF